MEVVAQETHSIRDYLEALKLPESFAEAHIPVREVLSNNVFLLKNGDLGVVYEFSGVYDEPLTYSQLQDEFTPLFKFLRQISLGVPMTENHQNTVLQVLCSQREQKVPPPKPPQGKGGPFEFSQTDLGRLLQTEEEALFSLGIVRRRFFLAVRYVVPKKKESALAKVGRVVDLFRSEEAHRNEDLLALEKARELFELVLEPLELEISVARPLRRLGTRELFAYYHDVLHGGEGGQLLFAEGKERLQENIYNPRLESTPSGFRVKDEDRETEVSAFCLSQLPSEYSIGLFRNFVDSIPCKRWDLVWTFSHGTGQVPADVYTKLWWFEKGEGNRPKYEALSRRFPHCA